MLHVFPTFSKRNSVGGGGVNSFVVLASELVGGRSRETELPCFPDFADIL